MRAFVVVMSLAGIAGTAAAQPVLGPAPPPPPTPPPAPPPPQAYYHPPQPAPLVQQAPAEVKPRHGFFLGGGVGLGRMVQNDGTDLMGMAGVLHLGWFINPRLAVKFEGEAVNHQFSSDSQLAQGSFGVGAKLWLAERIWIDGAVGLGWWKLTTTEYSTHCDWLFGCSTDAMERVDQSEKAPAFSIAGGIELYAQRTFAISAQVRSSAVFYDQGQAGNMMLAAEFELFWSRWKE